MLWQKKKKRKKATKSKAVTQTAPHQPVEELPQTTEPEKEEETPKQKKPAGKKCKKVLSPEKAFLDAFGRLTNRHRAWDVWRDFIIMFACSLSNPLDKEHRDKREALYLEIIKKYNKQEQEVFPELAAQTVLALEENPDHVCELMAEMTMDDVVKKIEQDGYISINDPCCGAGATLIAGINAARKQLEKANLNHQNHLLVVAQDIDETVALMCYIQLSLLGVAGYVKVGNSLTEPMTDNDDKENYWFTPMYFSNVWVLRRIFGGR